MGVNIPVGFGQFTWPVRLIGDLEEMVFTVGFVDGDDTDAPNDVANSISNALLAQPIFAASSISNQYSMGPGRVTVNRALGTFEGVGSVSRTGTASLTTLPHNCAILVRKNTALGGRRGKGRIYLPPWMIAESNITPAGVIFQTGVDSVTLDFETWRAQLSALNLQAVLLHGDSPNSATPSPTPILNFACQSVIATQRTRLRR